ncbi:uncharacterized protein KY384_001358 [Bacidia gigantensis]|uniref:uncharacterized protein n=1 Tax=Bacidia gigantensis TaxID=2732470 RepID=UPI001D056EA3|nr:uncharacterized protein KY384_001358 [Bacidia gigantensis]KAG8533618.1 hypothetical protein KY384_001358 [Bacidia gigantensis]
MKRLLSTISLFSTMLSSSWAAATPSRTLPWSVDHGQQLIIEGKEWRFHQKYANVWHAVEPGEWDDNIHLKRDIELDLSDGPTTSLEERGLVSRDIRDTCKKSLVCVGMAQAADYISLDENWDFITKWVGRVCSPATIAWKCLNHPLVISLMGPISGNVLIYAGYQGLIFSGQSKDIASSALAKPDPQPTFIVGMPDGGDVDPVPAAGQAGAPTISQQLEDNAYKTDAPETCSNLNSELDVIYCLGKYAWDNAGAKRRSNVTLGLTSPQGNSWFLTVTVDPPPPSPKCGAPEPSLAPSPGGFPWAVGGGLAGSIFIKIR